MSELGEETKVLVKETVKNTINRIVSESYAGKKVTEADDADDDKDAEKGEGKKKESDKKDDDDEGDEEDEEDDGSSDKLNESLKVVTAQKPRGSSKITNTDITVKDMRELTKLAKTGEYDWFEVTKRDGSTEEYTVMNGKLVLM